MSKEKVIYGAVPSGAGGQRLPFSPAIRAGDFVFISGQVAMNDKGEIEYGGIEAQRIETSFTIKLKRDGSLEAMPVPLPGSSTPYFRVYQESAMRAIIECQPYKLPEAYFDEWKFFEPVFTEKFS